jgi:hypothetical protein
MGDNPDKNEGEEELRLAVMIALARAVSISLHAIEQL